MKEDCSKIIEHYGVNHQQRKLAEEVFELNEAIIQYEIVYRDMCYSGEAINNQRQHIAEEIADVMVILKQIQYYYEIPDEEIEDVMKYKVQRTLKRMEKE